jgi:cob(I)alamin adenosyltransferase
VGNRLSKIYTRTGDDGSTGLGNGDRVAKDDPRVEAYGTVDELNSALGVLAAQPLPAGIDNLLADIQQKLFDLGGELCIPGTSVISAADIGHLERELDLLNADLPPLKDFVLPGGSPAAAACHLARAICRRAERRVVSLGGTAEVNELSVRYLNRLSDLLFVLARTLNVEGGQAEILWTGGKLKDD